MTIQVTAEDIQLGTPQRCLSCPIARALERETGRQWAVIWSSCDQLSAETGNPPAQTLLPLPKECMDFVETFDRFGGGLPFTFELDWRAS